MINVRQLFILSAVPVYLLGSYRVHERVANRAKVDLLRIVHIYLVFKFYRLRTGKISKSEGYLNSKILMLVTT